MSHLCTVKISKLSKSVRKQPETEAALKPLDQDILQVTQSNTHAFFNCRMIASNTPSIRTSSVAALGSGPYMQTC